MVKYSLHTEGYRSGHNGAVLKTVRGQPHKSSNLLPSAKWKNANPTRVFFVGEVFAFSFILGLQNDCSDSKGVTT